MEVLHTPSGGDEPDGAVLRLSMGKLRLLLPSEIEQETQETLRVEVEPFKVVDIISDGQRLWVKRHGPSGLRRR